MVQIDIEKPKACEWYDFEHGLGRCPLLTGDDCPLQECEESWTWEDQYAGCPLKEVQERETGKWSCITDGYVELWKCDQCGKLSNNPTLFCPRCGCAMTREGEQ